MMLATRFGSFGRRLSSMRTARPCTKAQDCIAILRVSSVLGPPAIDAAHFMRRTEASSSLWKGSPAGSGTEREKMSRNSAGFASANAT